MNKLLIRLIIVSLLGLQISCSHDNSSSSPSWHKLTGGDNQPKSVSKAASSFVTNQALDSILILDDSSQLWGYNNNIWKQLTHAGSMPVPDYQLSFNGLSYNFEKLNNLVIRDKSQQLWKYDGNTWVQISGISNSPKMIFNVYGMPSSSSVIASEYHQGGTFDLWSYNGTMWKKLTNLKESGDLPSLDVVFGKSTKDSILIRSNNIQLWFYNGNVWQQLTGKKDQPDSFVYSYGKITTSSIIMKDSKTRLWTYNGSKWQQVTGNPGQPNWVDIDIGRVKKDNPYGNPTPNSIILTDSNNNLWQFNGSSWKQISGNQNDPKQPHSIMGLDDIDYGPYLNVHNDNVILEDQASDLWVYDRQNWQKVTGKTNQPMHVKYLYLNATPDAIVMFDQDDNIWTYKNKVWQQITGKSGQPGRIFHEANGLLNDNFTQSPDAIIMVDDNWGLWNYNGQKWQKMTGDANQLTSIKNTVWSSDPNSMGIIKQVGRKYIAFIDESNNLWVWN